jgi:hypothetical protein
MIPVEGARHSKGCGRVKSSGNIIYSCIKIETIPGMWEVGVGLKENV